MFRTNIFRISTFCILFFMRSLSHVAKAILTQWKKQSFAIIPIQQLQPPFHEPIGSAFNSFQSSLLENYTTLFNDSTWKDICNVAKNAEAIEKDDPTSLGILCDSGATNAHKYLELQSILNVNKAINSARDTILFPQDKISCFGSKSVLSFLQNEKKFKLSRINKQEHEIVEADDVYNMMPHSTTGSSSSSSSLHFSQSLTSISHYSTLVGNQLLQSILTEIVETVEFSPNYNNLLQELIIQNEKKADWKWEHQTLINFYTNQKVEMYAHTDVSILTMIMVPSLWPNFRNKDQTCLINDLEGVAIQNTNNDTWQNGDELIYNCNEPCYLLFPGYYLSSLYSTLIGSNYCKGNHNEEKPKAIKAPTHKISRHRHHGRVSFVHFLYHPAKS